MAGETALNEDNEEEATINLNTMHQLYSNLPWSVSFSYGKALQKTTIVTWATSGPTTGQPADVAASQSAILARCKANGDACKGTYVAGTCASVGAGGNIEQAAGAY